ncbi:hypothetical protein CEXT_374551 [Caerostris extrusa]|uniref:Uncharacterized protein n=1 Tax=Caerostris extrusa TaxID=172846 RepID=A0AAV4N2S8_CAEEX|nr:hypothetical protein CEXT_374551 [Caerostris extrusa]
MNSEPLINIYTTARFKPEACSENGQSASQLAIRQHSDSGVRSFRPYPHAWLKVYRFNICDEKNTINSKQQEALIQKSIKTCFYFLISLPQKGRNESSLEIQNEGSAPSDTLDWKLQFMHA